MSPAVLVCLLFASTASASPNTPDAPVVYYAWNAGTGEKTTLAKTNLKPYCCGPEFPADLTEDQFAWVEFVHHNGDGSATPRSIVHVVDRADGRSRSVDIPEGLVLELSLASDLVFYRARLPDDSVAVHAREVDTGEQRSLPLALDATAMMDEGLAAWMGRNQNVTRLNVVDLVSGRHLGENVSLSSIGSGPGDPGVAAGVGMSNFNEGVVHLWGSGPHDGQAFAFDARRNQLKAVPSPNGGLRMAASGAALYWALEGPQPGAWGQSVIYRSSTWDAEPALIQSPDHAVAYPKLQVRDNWILLADYEGPWAGIPFPTLETAVCLTLGAFLARRRRVAATSSR